MHTSNNTTLIINWSTLRPDAPPYRLLLLRRRKHVDEVAPAVVTPIVLLRVDPRHAVRVVVVREVRVAAVEELAAVVVHHRTPVAASAEAVLHLHRQFKTQRLRLHRQIIDLLSRLSCGFFRLQLLSQGKKLQENIKIKKLKLEHKHELRRHILHLGNLKILSLIRFIWIDAYFTYARMIYFQEMYIKIAKKTNLVHINLPPRVPFIYWLKGAKALMKIQLKSASNPTFSGVFFNLMCFF